MSDRGLPKTIAEPPPPPEPRELPEPADASDDTADVDSPGRADTDQEEDNWSHEKGWDGEGEQFFAYEDDSGARPETKATEPVVLGDPAEGEHFDPPENSQLAAPAAQEIRDPQEPFAENDVKGHKSKDDAPGPRDTQWQAPQEQSTPSQVAQDPRKPAGGMEQQAPDSAQADTQPEASPDTWLAGQTLADTTSDAPAVEERQEASELESHHGPEEEQGPGTEATTPRMEQRPEERSPLEDPTDRTSQQKQEGWEATPQELAEWRAGSRVTTDGSTATSPTATDSAPIAETDGAMTVLDQTAVDAVSETNTEARFDKAGERLSGESRDQDGPKGAADTPQPADAPSGDDEWRPGTVLGDRHPEVASVLSKLMGDQQNRLDVIERLKAPESREWTMGIIEELAEGRVLGDRSLQEYTLENPGRGPLFDPVKPEVNQEADGTSRKDAYVERAKEVDPARALGASVTEAQFSALGDYDLRLRREVQPAVARDVNGLLASLPSVEGAELSIRTKYAEGLLDKVGRMVEGHEGRQPRPGYQVGDVIDAVGARVTVKDTAQLETVLEAANEYFGVGDSGRVLEIENMYAEPKNGSPHYRVVPMVVSIETNGLPYTYELQLTTRRASAAADLGHNTLYKQHVETTDGEKAAMRRMQAEAAALDQEETHRRHP
uniref:hypothetical protein n=1 Tax=Streptomyces antimycoticus TaxID=68175 RepID=UPI002F917896|nr:hypothetical protein OG546_49885 [Streptomyces antimycoticus]